MLNDRETIEINVDVITEFRHQQRWYGTLIMDDNDNANKKNESRKKEDDDHDGEEEKE